MKRLVGWKPVWIAFGAVALGGCVGAVPPQAVPSLSWSGGLQSTAPVYPRLAGAASVNSAADRTAVSVSVTGAPAAALLPWHVHQGRCGSGGPIVGPAGTYPLLRTGTDGRATASVIVSEPLLPNADYYVNVHAGVAELANIVACGQLVPSRG